MNVTTKKLLISILGAFIVCLIASTATAIVFAEDTNGEEEKPYWGNLKVGDEMRWHTSSPTPMMIRTDTDYELKILEIQGESLKVEYYSCSYNSHEPDIPLIEDRGIATWTSDDHWRLIYPAALLQENEDVKMTTYEYNGITYIGAYLKTGEQSGYWWDYLTGLRIKGLHYSFLEGVLEYTNANLTTPEMVPGSQRLLLQGYLIQHWIDLVVIVVLLSVVTVVLISLARYKPNE